MRRFRVLLLVTIALGSTRGAATPPTFADISAKIFRPMCLDCHGGGSPAADLDLASHASILRQKVVVPGEPDKSLLFEKVASGEMPLTGDPLTAAELAFLREWILAGAPDAPPAAAPTLKAVTPAWGLLQGGEEVVLAGEMLSATKTVHFDGKECAELRVVSATELRCRSPERSTAGYIAVTVTTDTESVVLEKAYEYRPALAGTYASLFVHVLRPKCLPCHNDEKPSHGLSVESYVALRAHRRAVVPFNLKDSRIYKKTREGEMPRGGPRLPANEVRAIASWIQAGAPEE